MVLGYDGIGILPVLHLYGHSYYLRDSCGYLHYTLVKQILYAHPSGYQTRYHYHALKCNGNGREGKE